MRPRSANEWRDFWRSGGARGLADLLWEVWDPIGGGARDEYETYVPRIATLLGSRAPAPALAAELGRIREHELGVEPSPEADRQAAERIIAWFEAP